MQSLNNIFCKKNFFIYLLTGVWNTAFGYLVYVFFVWLLKDSFECSYMIAALTSNIFSVTQSFFTYKFIVFKTKGNFLKEYIKCWGVYGSASIINLVLLPFFVITSKAFLIPPYRHFAPYVGGLILTGITVIISFLGHKNITFKIS